MTTAQQTIDPKKIGILLACYEITTDLFGGLTFKVNLNVYQPKEIVHGAGHISQATNPPLDIATRLDGNFTYMTVKPNNTHILVTATGYPIIHWPTHGAARSVILPNVELRMVLEDDWKSGTAQYKYSDSNGNWQSIDNAQVKWVEPSTK